VQDSGLRIEFRRIGRSVRLVVRDFELYLDMNNYGINLLTEKQLIMAKIKKNYSNGEITVVWQPNLCIHSTNCFKGLPQVFNPERKPWVNMDGTPTEKIRNQVEKCPSGALSYFMNEDQRNEGAEKDMVIDISDNGPILLKGPAHITYKGKTELKELKSIALCRCGGSSNKPFCDGSHRKIDFKG
jgi:uncharacterized Fe-S cluster protein YjdI